MKPGKYTNETETTDLVDGLKKSLSQRGEGPRSGGEGYRT
jgi:hypothetical protein